MKTEGATSAGPATVAMIASPLQALNLIEYAQATGTTVDLVLIGDGVSPEKTIPQIRTLLAQLPGTAVHVRATDGWAKGTPHWQAEVFSEILLHIGALGRPVERLVVGDFRITTAFQIARLLRLRPDQITVVDDGAATLLIDRRPGTEGERLLEEEWRSSPLPDNRMPRGVTLFTAYWQAIKAAPQDVIVRNDYAHVRARIADLRVDPDLVVVLGSPFTVPGSDVSPGHDLRIAFEVIDAARARFPGCRVIYAPHRREPAQKLDLLRAEVEVREFDVPFEVATLELGVVPVAVMGLQTSLMANLPLIFADLPEVQIISLRPADDLFHAGRAGHRDNVYDFFRQHTGGRVRVEELPGSPQGTERQLSWRWHPQAPARSITTRDLDEMLAGERPAYVSALLATVAQDADHLVLTGDGSDLLGWLGWLGEVVPPDVRISDLDQTQGSRKTVLLGRPVPGIEALAGPDLRVLWTDVDAGVQKGLLTAGFRLYAIADDTARWEEVREPGAPLGHLYAVRKKGAATVTVVTQWGGMLGGQRSHAEMTEALIRQGHMVDTVFPYDRGLGDLLHEVGGSVTLVDPLPVWYRRPAEPPVPVSDPLCVDDLGPAQPLLVQELRRRRPDVVLTQCALTPQGAIAAALVGIPHVWYVREFGDIDLGLVLPGPPAEVGAVLGASAAEVITNSACVREYFFPGHPERATVVHPAPVIPGATAERDSWTRRRAEVFTVGVVADIRSGKDQTTMLEAAVALRSRGVPIRVMLFGGGLSEARRSLESAVRGRGATDLIHFAGFEPSRERMFSGLDAVIVPSTAEAFGRVPFEAAAFDVPIVYADVAGPSEYMRDGETGVAFAPGDVDGLADAIERLAADEALRERLARAARADLASPARQATLAEQVDDVIRRAVRVGVTADQRAWGERVARRLAASLGLEAAPGHGSHDGER
ncbi:glycosyltransferase family 4 protein [Nocardioides nematodiphilus]|uniref:glycosyltransferase family 4 protein n=1 Tax=Nocardioides nematodiphilus TaxID=2849669 RepID=UPI001CD9B060|nr:glycosyltransferase family 4 protein [Nocardioides nematodiphilus]MCA1984217.1 glycosyltransferase family 4 protein [Nocardioides nematodiphilus]